MKKVVLALVALNSVLASSAVVAGNHTVSLGYAQGKLQGLKGDIEGVNLQYRYEWDSPVSIIGSFSYMDGRQATIGKMPPPVEREDKYYNNDYRYYSLLVGPAYRLNDHVSFYGVAGVALVKNSTKNKEQIGDWPVYDSAHSDKSLSFAYGVGIVINPRENISINVGYEGTNARLDNHNHSMNGFNIGAGYRF